MKLLTVMCGPPGAGKSTWIENNCPDAVRLSTEVVRRNPRRRMMSQLGGIKTLAPDLLRRGQHVVVEACSTKKRDRLDWLQVARVSHAPTQLVIVNTDLQTCLARQSPRGRHGVPAAVVQAHHDRLMADLDTIPLEGWGEILEVSGLPVR